MEYPHCITSHAGGQCTRCLICHYATLHFKANKPSHALPLMAALEQINMPSYFDIYVISPKRTETEIESFLDEFVPHREEHADEYEYPQYSESPDITYTEAKEIISVCCGSVNSEYGVYWRSVDRKKPEYGMIFFLKDGHVIYGLSTDDAHPEYAVELLNKMKAYTGSSLGYIGHEASPDASDMEEFKGQIEVHRNII